MLNSSKFSLNVQCSTRWDTTVTSPSASILRMVIESVQDLMVSWSVTPLDFGGKLLCAAK